MLSSTELLNCAAVLLSGTALVIIAGFIATYSSWFAMSLECDFVDIDLKYDRKNKELLKKLKESNR